MFISRFIHNRCRVGDCYFFVIGEHIVRYLVAKIPSRPG